MAIKWGNWSSGQSGSKSRLGVERRISQTASQVTVTLDVYLDFSGYYASSPTATLRLTGGHSATHTVNLSFSGSGRRGPWTFTQTFTRPWGGNGSRSTSISVTGFAGGSPSLSEGYTLPRRLYSAPARPSSVATKRTAEGQAQLSWAVPVSTAAPVGGVSVVRQSNNNSWGTNAATFKAASGSTKFNNLARGSRYRWRVQAKNRDATGPAADSPWVYMRPNDVANVVATRSGANIRVSWTDRNAIPYGGFRIYHNGTLAATVSAGTTSWTHTNPDPAIAHRYSVRAYYGTLNATHVNSNTVQLLMPPLAPTNLDPDGGYVPEGSTLAVSWTHNSVDGSGQDRREVQARKAGTTTWTTYTGSTASSQSIPVGDLAGDGESIEWRVRTKGDHADFGPWSDIASVGVASRPTVAFTAPSEDATIEAAKTAISFTISRTPASYVLEVVTDAGVLHKRVEDYTESSPVTVQVSGLRNATAYTAKVTATERVPSETVTVSFTALFPQPDPPTITGEWDVLRGSVHLTVAGPEDGPVPAQTVRVERLVTVVDGDETWQELDTVPAGQTIIITDDHANLAGAQYRAIAVATVGQDLVESAPSDTLDMGVIPERADFLNFGEHVVRIRYRPGLSRTAQASELALIDLDDGTSDPVAIFGPKERHTTPLSGLLLDDPEAPAAGQAQDFLALGTWKDLVLLRTIDGPPVWGVVSGVSVDRELWGGYEVSLTHTKAR